jgi:hypothetical protein
MVSRKHDQPAARYTGTDDDPGTGKAPLTARQRRNRLLVIRIVVTVIVVLYRLSYLGIVVHAVWRARR